MGHVSLRTSFTAVAPGKVREIHKGVEEVEERPGDNDDVVDILKEDHRDGGVADALEYGGELADHRHPALADVLADRHLQEKQGNAADNHREEVGDEESSWQESK